MGVEALGRATFWAHAKISEFAAHFGIGDRFIQQPAKARNHRIRRAARCHEAKPGLHHNVRNAGFGEGWHIRQRWVAFAARDGKRADLPGADGTDLGWDVFHHHLHLAGQQRLQGWRSTAEGHMHQCQAKPAIQ